MLSGPRRVVVVGGFDMGCERWEECLSRNLVKFYLEWG